MKYLINESQLDRMIGNFLDSKDFKIIDSRYGTFFAYYDSDSWAQMRYLPASKILLINGELSLELEKLFGIEPEHVRILLTKWVSEKLNVDINPSDTKTYHGTVSDVNLSMR